MYDNFSNQNNPGGLNNSGSLHNPDGENNQGSINNANGLNNAESINNPNRNSAGNNGVNGNTGMGGNAGMGNVYGAQTNGTYRYSGNPANHYSYSSPQPMGTSGAGGQPPKKEKKRTGGFKKVLAAAGLGICFGLCAGISFYAVDRLGSLYGQSDTLTAMVEEETSTKEGSQDTTQISTSSIVESKIITDVSEVVDNVMPSVVSIVNKYTENISYFGQQFSQEGSASGSGIIVGMNDTELLIATNYHVIESATELSVSFVDDSVATAQLKGSDASMDLAVIAVALDDLEQSTKESIAVAQMGDSDSLSVGEPAIAIGNALGYGQSVTTGVISALNREVSVSDTVSGTFIQTDAAINPGNSGGALLNVKGEVIGINSNKIGGEAIEGMGYAIPISSAKPIIEELMNRETKTKVDENNAGYLGISGFTVTEDVVNVYGMPQGVYVAQVYQGSGAANAGIIKGGIITGLSDFTITSMAELQEALQYYAVGDTVEVTIMYPGREGYEASTVNVTLGPQTQPAE